MSSTTKAKLARKRQKETLKFIQKQQQAETKEVEPQPPGTSQETDEWLEYLTIDDGCLSYPLGWF